MLDNVNVFVYPKKGLSVTIGDMDTRVRLTSWVDEAQKAKVQSVAKKRKVTESAIIRELIKKYL